MNPLLKYSHSSKLFGLFYSHPIRVEARKSGFEWDDRGFWKTPSPYRALQFARYADDQCKMILHPYLSAIEASYATDSIQEYPAPEGLAYLPFQKAGISYALKRASCLLGDQPGLGKTIQAIGVANAYGLSRLLIICPAGLRLNWAREVEKWHLYNKGIEVLLNGESRRSGKAQTIITSYDLARHLSTFGPDSFDMIVIDEAHYCKNPTAQRTKIVLGSRGNPGLIHCAPRKLVLTGTPIPNRVNEIYPVLRRLAPQVIDSMNYRAFLKSYAIEVHNQFGSQVVGVQNEAELSDRLRAGFMVRRLKEDVLKDLPAKQYKLVVFPKGGGFASVLKKESQFSAREIIKHGVPFGSALPEVRREMGIAKAPLAVRYITDLLEDGVQKIVVFAHHREVVSILEKGLSDYAPLTITGSTSQKDKQANTDTFQTSSRRRVLIANIVAGGVGNTWTAAQDVVFAESSWVPGENEQAEDRLHRVGQTGSVLVHILVVEGSLDAAILGSAAKKQMDINRTLDRRDQ